MPVRIITPVNVDVLASLVASCTDHVLRDYVLHGFRFGFDTGFRGLATASRPKNLRSALAIPDAVTTAINLEISRGHTAGPFREPPFPLLHCSPLGAAPKKDGTARLILDLSSPRGTSVNDGIDKTGFSVRYSRFDDGVRMVRQIGRSAFLAKLDVRHAFRICPVRLDQFYLLGFRWNRLFFVDTRLPFGSRSSPFIFNSFAMLLCWALIYVCGIAMLIHYLDDYLICSPSQAGCSADMVRFLDVCDAVGVPIASDKTEGPSQCLTFLGVEIDALNQVVRLPPDKLSRLLDDLRAWGSRTSCTRRELESLVGTLSFAAHVVRPGRLFVRRLIDLSTTVPTRDTPIQLSAEAMADIDWWARFVTTWNGVSIIPTASHTSTSLQLFTDASFLGIGACCGSAWFSAPLPASLRSRIHDPVRKNRLSINVFELLAVVAAVFTWGRAWKDSSVRIFTDNRCVVDVWRSTASTSPHILRLLRPLFFFCAENNIHLSFSHIAGVKNSHADALSRLQVARFRQLAPFADAIATETPPLIWTLL